MLFMPSRTLCNQTEFKCYVVLCSSRTPSCDPGWTQWERREREKKSKRLRSLTAEPRVWIDCRPTPKSQQLDVPDLRKVLCSSSSQLLRNLPQRTDKDVVKRYQYFYILLSSLFWLRNLETYSMDQPTVQVSLIIKNKQASKLQEHYLSASPTNISALA